MQMWKITVAAAAIAAVTLGRGTSIAAGKPAKPADIPVRSTFFDTDAGGGAYTLQSDGGGTYVDGVAGVTSVLMANVYNNLYDGDWQMDASASATRRVAITLSPSNAVQAGTPGYTVPPDPPFWGVGFEAARVFDGCTKYNKSVLAMQPGGAITCELLVRWNDGSSSYRLDMGTPLEAPESTPARISCNAADAKGCSDWYIDPIPVVNADGTTSAGSAIARLVSIAKGGAVTNLGDFYMTFHFHVTRP
jgi:hypothetical protein